MHEMRSNAAYNLRILRIKLRILIILFDSMAKLSKQWPLFGWFAQKVWGHAQPFPEELICKYRLSVGLRKYRAA